MKRGTPTHPKMDDLMERLSVPRYAAAGILELLWHYAAKYTPQGDVGRYPDSRIAKAVEWDGDTETLISALVNAGWLDTCPKYRLIVHDWAAHADQAVKKRLQRQGLQFRISMDSHCPDMDGQSPDMDILPVPVPEPVPEPVPPPAAHPGNLDALGVLGAFHTTPIRDDRTGGVIKLGTTDQLMAVQHLKGLLGGLGMAWQPTWTPKVYDFITENGAAGILGLAAKDVQRAIDKQQKSGLSWGIGWVLGLLSEIKPRQQRDGPRVDRAAIEAKWQAELDAKLKKIRDEKKGQPDV